jgi:uncharacterized protein (DUF4415 family)
LSKSKPRNHAIVKCVTQPETRQRPASIGAEVIASSPEEYSRFIRTEMQKWPRLTIYMDEAILKRFKAQSEKSGKGYQTLINEALKLHLGLTEQPVTQDLVRKIVREELAAHG